MSPSTSSSPADRLIGIPQKGGLRQPRCNPRSLGPSSGKQALPPGSPLPSLLPQELQKRVDLSTIAVDDRGELLALGDAHADILDDHVDDLRAASGIGQDPIDLGRWAVFRADDFAGDQRVLALGSESKSPTDFLWHRMWHFCVMLVFKLFRHSILLRKFSKRI
jgi:hypothetical protein